jgi:hypothetical protein
MVNAWPDEGEVFYAFGGFDLSAEGTLNVDRGPLHTSWTFQGAVHIDDFYSFAPDNWYKLMWTDFAAAHDLETNPAYGDRYKPFNTKLDDAYSASGCVNHQQPSCGCFSIG